MYPFKHKVAIQLRFKDGDTAGHVNNANHLSFIEYARMKYFEDVIGADSSWSRQQEIILAHVSIDYKAPLFIHDAVFVYTRCVKMGTKSLELMSVIVRDVGGKEEVVAEGKAVLVCYEYAMHRSAVIPEAYRKRISEFEQR